MENVLTITRGTRQIADGVNSLVSGCPLAGCNHALDIVALVRAAYVNILDRGAKQLSLSFKVFRQFSTAARAIHHAMMEAQNTTGRADFVLTFDDGTDVHTWTVTGAGWPRIVPELCNGVGVTMTYEVIGGQVVYAGPLPLTYALLGEDDAEILGEDSTVIETEH